MDRDSIVQIANKALELYEKNFRDFIERERVPVAALNFLKHEKLSVAEFEGMKRIYVSLLSTLIDSSYRKLNELLPLYKAGQFEFLPHICRAIIEDLANLGILLYLEPKDNRRAFCLFLIVYGQAKADETRRMYANSGIADEMIESEIKIIQAEIIKMRQISRKLGLISDKDKFKDSSLHDITKRMRKIDEIFCAIQHNNISILNTVYKSICELVHFPGNDEVIATPEKSGLIFKHNKRYDSAGFFADCTLFFLHELEWYDAFYKSQHRDEIKNLIQQIFYWKGKHRAERRKKKIVAYHANSFEEAEEIDLDYWQSMSPQERLSAALEIHKDVKAIKTGKVKSKRALH